MDIENDNYFGTIFLNYKCDRYYGTNDLVFMTKYMYNSCHAGNNNVSVGGP
jgi:hypothetical protein